MRNNEKTKNQLKEKGTNNQRKKKRKKKGRDNDCRAIGKREKDKRLNKN